MMTFAQFAQFAQFESTEDRKVHRDYNPLVVAQHGDKWYIVRRKKNPTPHMAMFGSHEYLHHDGEWRDETSNNGKPTGYYATQSQATRRLVKQLHTGQ